MLSQATYAVVCVVILVIVIASIAFLLYKWNNEKPPKKDEPTLPSVHLPKPGKSDVKPEEKGTRVVTSLLSRKNKSNIEKTKTPDEAEFRQLMAWKSPEFEVKTCSCCGAEIGRLVSICPACGQTN